MKLDFISWINLVLWLIQLQNILLIQNFEKGPI